ncbi:DCC1-like thiol-disulfide oxidoreductase family protein [Duganella violaceipulchra]|uniref:DCC family thiol-disulfide oxidoreductase YuxK n=1 Tax=Duganella violaceipulchra TaxID=2849652 RepID=A0AA41LB98_9BURK|nr:DCC1-like thiol-disulfide oxidoreductase family protein [Duganella violaceicalia]MBV6325090.1 DUF393 domain-containing protein [Duganella violaceicalia]MCP2010604.1 putative DCC family thiol-disulfide oxidoreductase YuxK [Duganella violaceicalia]
MDSLVLVYDADCPFCADFVALTRLRQSVGKVDLVNARQGGPVVDAVRAAGYDLNTGMVLNYQGNFYHGAECLHMLALLSAQSDGFNRTLAWLFRSQLFCRCAYPLLRTGRRIVLAIKGMEKLN